MDLKRPISFCYSFRSWVFRRKTRRMRTIIFVGIHDCGHIGDYKYYRHCHQPWFKPVEYGNTFFIMIRFTHWKIEYAFAAFLPDHRSEEYYNKHHTRNEHDDSTQ